jgi:hypothetical protein
MQTHLLFLFIAPINMNIHVQSDLASCIYKDEIKCELSFFLLQELNCPHFNSHTWISIIWSFIL